MEDEIEKLCSVIKTLFPKWACGLSTNPQGKKFLYIVNATTKEFYSAFKKTEFKYIPSFSDKYYTTILVFDGNKYHIVIKDDTNLISLNNAYFNNSEEEKTSLTKKDFSQVSSYLKKTYQLNCKQTTQRGKPRHIEIKDLSVEEFLILFPESVFEKHSEFSKKYKTTFIEVKGGKYPILIRHNSNFIDKNLIFRDKELNPSNMNIEGVFIQEDDMINTVLSIINRLKTESKEKNKVDALDILSSIVLGKPLSPRQQLIYEDNRNVIEKDFGEILCGLYYLKKDNVAQVEFSEGTSGAFYDLIVVYNSGFEKKINVKSGVGSGQSFKHIPTKSISKYREKKQPNGLENIYINVIEILINNKRGEGLLTIFRVAEEFRKCDDILGNTIDKLLNEFNLSEEENILVSDYNNRLSKIIQESGGDVLIGLLSPNIDDIKTEKDLKRCLAFSISTLIRKYSSSSVITKIMTSPSFIRVIPCHLSYDNEKGIIVKEYVNNESVYSFHYWGSIKNPTNNMLGYKVSF